MTDTLRTALLISAIGMGLVFGVILLLWGLIALVVRLGAGRDTGRGRETAGEGAELAEELDEEAVATDLKAQAAAAAVGAYLAAQRDRDT